MGELYRLPQPIAIPSLVDSSDGHNAITRTFSSRTGCNGELSKNTYKAASRVSVQIPSPSSSSELSPQPSLRRLAPFTIPSSTSRWYVFTCFPSSYAVMLKPRQLRNARRGSTPLKGFDGTRTASTAHMQVSTSPLIQFVSTCLWP